MKHSAPYRKQGFTLIEVSIVLIVTGLLIGGILLGQTLIRSAEIRATITQKGKFDTAVNTFKLKYNNFLPGDIPSTVAVQVGLFDISGVNSGAPYDIIGWPLPVTYATGNGLIEPWAFCCESLTFWRHLSEAQLIEGQYGMDAINPISSVTGYVTTATTSDVETSLFFPPAKIGDSFFTVINTYFTAPDGITTTPLRNYFYLNHYYEIGDASSPASGSYRLPPLIIYELDTKIDDGLPNGGIARAPQFNWNTVPEDTRCTYGGVASYAAEAQYNTDAATGGNSRACYLYIEFK